MLAASEPFDRMREALRWLTDRVECAETCSPHPRQQARENGRRRSTSTRRPPSRLAHALAGLSASTADLAAITTRAQLLLDAASLLGIKPDLWQVQNALLGSFLKLADTSYKDAPPRDAFAALASRLNVSPSLLGWRT